MMIRPFLVIFRGLHIYRGIVGEGVILFFMGFFAFFGFLYVKGWFLCFCNVGYCVSVGFCLSGCGVIILVFF